MLRWGPSGTIARACGAILLLATPVAAAPAPTAPGPAPAWVRPATTPRGYSFSIALEKRFRGEALGAYDLLARDPAMLQSDGLDAAGIRSRRAERMVTRAVRDTLDDRLEALVRETRGLGGALRFVDGLGSRDTTVGGTLAPAGDASAATPRLGAVLRLRLDAHPRLQAGLTAGSLSARVELPLLERGPRFVIEEPLGRAGRAAVRGGRSGERGGWIDALISLRF